MSGKNYSSLTDTKKHIERVGAFISRITLETELRISKHDESKLELPEVEYFDIYTPKLAGMTYGSAEYKQCLQDLIPALNHHYSVNRHHPEYFENGIAGMNLVDIIEMFCDWCAAAERHADGDIIKSIAINQKRFQYSDCLKNIFENTYKDILRGRYER